MQTKVVSPLISQVVEGTLRNVVNSFLVDRKTRGLSPKTLQYYSDELRYFSDHMDLIGVITFREITPDLIRQYLLNLAKQRNKGGVHAEYRALHALYTWYEFEFEPDNWKNPIRKVKVQRPAGQPLPAHENIRGAEYYQERCLS